MLEELEVALFRGRFGETFGTTAIPDFPMDFVLENRSSERSAREIASSRCASKLLARTMMFGIGWERESARSARRDRDSTSRFAKGIGTR